MKVFWAVVLILMVAVGAMLLLRGGGRPAAVVPVTPAATARDERPSAVPHEDRTSGEASRQSAAAPKDLTEDAGQSKPATQTADSTSKPSQGADVGGVRPVPAEIPSTGISPKGADPARAEPTVDPKLAKKPADNTPANGSADAAATAGVDAAKPMGDASAITGPPAPTEADRAAMELQQGLDAALGLGDDHAGGPAALKGGSGSSGGSPTVVPAAAASATAKAKLTPRDDGTTLVDDRFVIKGKGEKTDPYVVTWEMLVSAQESYQPRLGRKIIPDRLKMLDGKWVRMSGFVAFPIMAQSQDEMLMMLNQWDGCCIGVPPTPYDAVEVKLAAAAKGDDRLRVSGAVTGILRVDPYLVKDWLVSLYLMDDAELTVEAGAAKRAPSMIEGHQAQ